MSKIAAVLVFTILSPSLSAKELEPGEPFDYPAMAFFPDRWVKKKLTAPMLPWVGDEIVLVTPDKPLDGKVVGEFVKQLDSGWRLYRELVGKRPRHFKTYEGTPTIVGLPGPGLSCGYGCGYVGTTGIEMSQFDRHYAGVKANPLNIPHAYFYEMGRNYFVFGDRHSCFTTGFAVFMRYVCMDSLALHDQDKRTRRTIEDAIGQFEKNDMSFLDGLTSHGKYGEKHNRLKDHKGKSIVPSDQPVLYASLMLQLHREFGGNEFLKRFYGELRACRPIKPVDAEAARQQSLMFLVCASVAAKTELTDRFTKKWKLALDDQTIVALGKIDWEKAGAAEVLDGLQRSPR